MHHPATLRSARVEQAEARLVSYFTDYAEHPGRSMPAHVLGHPVATLRAALALGDLPVEQVEVGSGLEGRLVREALPGTSRGPRSVAAALALPSRPEEYSRGSSKQTVRRKTRVAERAGVTWSRISDPAEKRRLLDLANEYERTHPLQQYRKAPPEDSTLLDVDLWLLARGGDGRPLLLSVTPVHGRAALLGLFRTLEVSDEASAARYLMTKVLAEHLIDLGVSHLFDGVHPAHLPNGLRHFQAMVGFRLLRVAQRRAAPGSPTVAESRRASSLLH